MTLPPLSSRGERLLALVRESTPLLLTTPDPAPVTDPLVLPSWDDLVRLDEEIREASKWADA